MGTRWSVSLRVVVLLSAGLVLLSAGLSLPACSGNGPNGKEAEVQETTGAEAGCVEGEACDDSNTCTMDDKCTSGVCAGNPYSCGAPEICEEGGGCDGEGGCLVPTLAPGWCMVDHVCIEEGEADSDSPCMVCTPEKDQASLSAAETGTACEDGNVCTEDDFCDSGDCLAGSPPTCADGILCTMDECDPLAGCKHEADHTQCADEKVCTRDECIPEQGGCVNTNDDSIPCGDEDVCTLNDHCSSGACVTDPDPVNCDDANPCTEEQCHSSYGCLYVFNEATCDDGQGCTEDDKCFYGKCQGVENWWSPCPQCNKDFPGEAQKIITLRVGKGGHPGEAVNVDNDLKTCSPKDDCEVGLDNALTFAGSTIDEVIADNMGLDAGVDALIFLAHMAEPKLDGSPFDMNLIYAELSLVSNPDCDFTSQACIYTPHGLSFDLFCNPLVVFTNTTITDGVLKAGGSGSLFPFQMSFVNGQQATMVLFNAKVEAQVVMDDDGGIASMKGVVGGAVTKEQLKAVVSAIPDEYVPLPKEMILAALDAIPQDIDLNGDGMLDASSIALVFETIPGTLEQFTSW